MARWLALALLTASLSAAAETRYAVLLASNLGARPGNVLTFAEADAMRLRDVLVELGDFAPGRVVLALGASARRAREALAQTVAAAAREPGPTTVLVYFSGHASPAGLEFGAERIPFDELRSWARQGTGTTRILVIDACHSGVAVRPKGGHRDRGLEVEQALGQAARGYAILTSSSDHEQSQESTALRASVFTHHFTSGLRGAADLSADGRVTLSEAWNYASRRTTAASTLTNLGAQHPAFELHLAGQDELELTRSTAASARLTVTPDAEARVFVLATNASGGDRALVAEGVAGPGAPLTVAVVAGHYEVLAANGWGDWSGATVAVGRGGRRDVAGDDFTPRTLVRTADKGGLFIDGTVSVALGFRASSMPLEGQTVAYGATVVAAFEPWPRVQPSLWLTGATAPDGLRGEPHGVSAARDVVRVRGRGRRAPPRAVRRRRAHARGAAPRGARAAPGRVVRGLPARVARPLGPPPRDAPPGTAAVAPMSRMPLERTALLALVLACGPGLDEGAAPTPVTPSAWAESFESAEAEARWQGIDTCGDSTEIGWVVQGGYLESYGNCRWEPDKAHLGSFRRDATSRFDAGWLVAEVAVDDDGRWGLLWGTEGAFFRFGLARDTNSATLDLVALPGYDFAGRVAPSAVDGHLQRLAYSDKVAAPYLGTAEIAIHRTPERTTAWVDRAPVLWLEGDPFGTTTVGVYVWRMSHLKLDRIAIYDDGPPPWERPL